MTILLFLISKFNKAVTWSSCESWLLSAAHYSWAVSGSIALFITVREPGSSWMDVVSASFYSSFVDYYYFCCLVVDQVLIGFLLEEFLTIWDFYFGPSFYGDCSGLIVDFFKSGASTLFAVYSCKVSVLISCFSKIFSSLAPFGLNIVFNLI